MPAAPVLERRNLLVAGLEPMRAARVERTAGRDVDEGEQTRADLSHPESRSPHEKLSNRELEVLRQIGAGKSVKEIAAALHLSVPTVHAYHAFCGKDGHENQRGTDALRH